MGSDSAFGEPFYVARNKDKIRSDVNLFKEAMEEKLEQNSHKGDWTGIPFEYLMQRLFEETDELAEAIAWGDMEAVMKEAADVGNFAMMICSNADRKKVIK